MGEGAPRQSSPSTPPLGSSARSATLKDTPPGSQPMESPRSAVSSAIGDSGWPLAFASAGSGAATNRLSEPQQRSLPWNRALLANGCHSERFDGTLLVFPLFFTDDDGGHAARRGRPPQRWNSAVREADVGTMGTPPLHHAVPGHAHADRARLCRGQDQPGGGPGGGHVAADGVQVAWSLPARSSAGVGR